MSDSRSDEKVAMLQGEIDNLNQKIAFLEERLKELESNRNVPTQPWPVTPFPSSPLFSKSCSKCGMKFDGPMGYCCPNSDCPSGLGPIMCNT